MKYFIDFEAAQSNEIISIGCVNELGQVFYSLVQSQAKISWFIASLTGISNSDLDTAPTVDEAFEDFYDYLNKDSAPEFYCYGDTDIKFIRETLNNATQFYSQAALGLLQNNLIDYAPRIAKHFEITNTIALVKVVSYYRNDPELKQSHNALEDALWLKEIYENAQNEVINECPFPTYQKQPGATPNRYMYVFDDGVKIRKFNTVGDATRFLLTSVMKNQPDTKKKNVATKIRKAAANHNMYCGFLIERILIESEV